jgi:hypothetical protein
MALQILHTEGESFAVLLKIRAHSAVCTHKVIVALTVKEILEQQIAKK